MHARLPPTGKRTDSPHSGTKKNSGNVDKSQVLKALLKVTMGRGRGRVNPPPCGLVLRFGRFGGLVIGSRDLHARGLGGIRRAKDKYRPTSTEHRGVPREPSGSQQGPHFQDPMPLGALLIKKFAGPCAHSMLDPLTSLVPWAVLVPWIIS